MTKITPALSILLCLVFSISTSMAFQTTTDTKSSESKSTDDSKKQDAKPIETADVLVADGAIRFSVPKTWKKTKPKINFIEAEYKIVRESGDERDGRLTIMGAGGSIDANIQRWVGQFKNPETKTKKNTINECTVHVVSISGTFMESSGGPFGPKTERENYQMLAAIVESPDNGNYFVKLYGPKKTIKKNAKGFEHMIKSLMIID